MRVMAGLIAAGLLAASALPWAAGMRAERAYRDALDGIPASYPSAQVEVTAGPYERGWLRSRATTVVRPVQAVAPGERLVVHHEIEHGPFPPGHLREAGWSSGPVLARAVSTAVWEADGAEGEAGVALPVRLVAVLSKQGASLALRPDPERAGRAVAGGVEVDWEGMLLEAHVAPGADALSGELVVPWLAVGDGEPAFRLADLGWTFDYRRLHPGSDLYAGEGRVRIGRLEARAGGSHFLLRGLEMGDTSHGADDTFSIEVDGALESVRQDARRIGPVAWALAANRLATEPLAVLSALSRRPEDGAEAAAAAQAELVARMGELWPAFMGPGPEIVLSRLLVEMPEGELRMALRVAVDGSQPALLAHPLATLAALEVDAELAVPDRLLHDWLESGALADPAGFEAAPGGTWSAAARRMESLLQQGVLQRHGEHYTAELRVRQGVLRVNGRILPLSAVQP